LPEIEVADTTYRVRVKPEAYEEFVRLVKASCRLSLEVQRGWICKSCAGESPNAEYICMHCENFRSLDTYPCLLTQPERATQKEISELSRRRQVELQLISELDTGNAVSTWYLINAEWITQWKSFVFNKPSPYPEQNSPNKEVGVLPPSPICNNRLFIDPSNPVILRPQLQVVSNYRGVNERVWNAYLKFYGGGPAIVRKKLNIYEEGIVRASSSLL
jgi:hypothetical protein